MERARGAVQRACGGGPCVALLHAVVAHVALAALARPAPLEEGEQDPAAPAIAAVHEGHAFGTVRAQSEMENSCVVRLRLLELDCVLCCVWCGVRYCWMLLWWGVY